MVTSHEEHQLMIEDCEKRSAKLSDWESTFIDSVSNQIADRPLSPGQVEKLEQIWERVT